MNHHAVVGSLTLAIATSSYASFTVIKNFASWSAAAGPSTKLDFVFSQPQTLSDQYASLGVLFPEAEEVAFSLPSAFLQDGWGCVGDDLNDADVHLKFLQPQFSIGAWFPGDLLAKLYWQGQLIYTSPNLQQFPLSYGFGGIVSTQPFDEVVFVDPLNFVNIDDIYFASAVPAPSAALILLATFARARRRST